jgi:ribosome-binding factor A
MSKIRVARVGEQLKKEIADVLRSDLKDPGIGFATVTRVDMAGDLQHAKVYISVFGDNQAKGQTMSALQKASGFIRGEVGRRLRLRISPELVFKLDESGEYSAHIQTVLRSLDVAPDGKSIGSGDNPSEKSTKS